MKKPFTATENPSARGGFTLIETVLMIALVCALAVLSGPAVQALSGAGTVNRAASDMTATLEQARAFAMANRTFVRIALAELPGNKGTVVLPLYAVDGTLDAASAQDMCNQSLWRPIGRPLVLNSFVRNDSLASSELAMENDLPPSASDISPVSLPMPGLGGVTGPLQFDSFLQFSPNGEARVQTETLARFIKIGLDQAGPAAGRNPFVLRISGTNGTISVLRKENGL